MNFRREGSSSLVRKIPLQAVGLAAIGLSVLFISDSSQHIIAPTAQVQFLSNYPSQGSKYIITKTFTPSPPTHPTTTPTPTFSPTQRPITPLPIETLLWRTRTILDENGSVTTFKPKNEYTREIYNKVIENVLLGEYAINGKPYYSTIWVYDPGDVENYYFVTSVHSSGNVHLSSLNLWQAESPKPIKVDLTGSKSANDGKKDIYMLRVSKKNVHDANFRGLKTLTDYHNLYYGQNALAVGYPDIISGLTTAKSSAEVITLQTTDPSYSEKIELAGLLHGGGSGTVGVVVIEGEPFAFFVGSSYVKSVITDMNKSGYLIQGSRAAIEWMLDDLE